MLIDSLVQLEQALQTSPPPLSSECESQNNSHLSEDFFIIHSQSLTFDDAQAWPLIFSLLNMPTNSKTSTISHQYNRELSS